MQRLMRRCQRISSRPLSAPSYLRSRAEVQGQDCVETYMALHRCFLTHASSFEKYVAEDGQQQGGELT